MGPRRRDLLKLLRHAEMSACQGYAYGGVCRDGAHAVPLPVVNVCECGVRGCCGAACPSGFVSETRTYACTSCSLQIIRALPEFDVPVRGGTQLQIQAHAHTNNQSKVMVKPYAR